MNTSAERRQRLRQLIEESAVGMLTTTDQVRLVSRPMLALLLDGDSAVYFLTHASSAKVQQVRSHPRVALTFNGPNSTYLAITGHAAVIQDADIIERLWNPTYRAWFPDGAEDREVALLQLVIEKADYWQAPTSRVARLIEMIEAVVTHTPYEASKTNLT
jgi:general stress protein 26